MAPRKSNGPNEGIRCKNMMYEQQEEHLPFPVEELEVRIKRLKPTRYAYIFHKGDINEKGELEAPHIHVMLCFKNARYINAVAAKIGDKPQSITKWDERANNGFAYLIHATSGANGKAQYSADDVTANFDFRALIEKRDTRPNRGGPREKVRDSQNSAWYALCWGQNQARD